MYRRCSILLLRLSQLYIFEMKKLFFYHTACISTFLCLVLSNYSTNLQAQNKVYKELYNATANTVRSNSAKLEAAIQQDDADFLESYFSKENIRIVGNDCLLMATIYDAPLSLKTLMAKGADPQLLPDDKNLLIHAIYNNANDALQLLLQQKLELYPSLPNNYTLLHFATENGKINSIPHLINAGLIVDQTEVEGNTALHIALQKNYNHALHQLLKYQANTEIANLKSMYPLHLAVEDNNMSAVKTLLSYGANTQVINDAGYLPLHYAIENTNEKMVELLLLSMPSLSADGMKKDPYKLAKKTKNKNIKSLIKNRTKQQKGFYGYVTYSPPKCNQSCDGQINIEVKNGKPPFTYTWDHDSQISENIATDLCGGNYTIVVKDKKKKTWTASVHLQSPKKVNAIVVKDFDKEAHPRASIKAIAEGGVAPYTYTWNEVAGNKYYKVQNRNNTLVIKDVYDCESSPKSFEGKPKAPMKDVTEATEEVTEETTEEKKSKDDNIPNNILNIDKTEALAYFEHENVNVVILSSKGNEVGRFTIRDYLNRLILLKKYQPSIVEKETNDSGKISLLYVNETIR